MLGLYDMAYMDNGHRYSKIVCILVDPKDLDRQGADFKIHKRTGQPASTQLLAQDKHPQ